MTLPRCISAGTGLLAAAFAPYSRRYTVTDTAALLPLLRKNAGLNFPGWPNAPNSNVFVEELDWVALHALPPTQRTRMFNTTQEPVDILLVVDCIYHPSLLPALVATIGHLATPGQTAVLVVVELRAEDVVREFLEHWIASGRWDIWRVGGGQDGMGPLGKPYVMWLGWRAA